MIPTPFNIQRSMTNYLRTAGVITKQQATDIHKQIDADELAEKSLAEQSYAAYQKRMDERPWWRKLLGMYP